MTLSSPSFDLIIWDCDGVLVDSEVIACVDSAKALCDLGYEISMRDFIDRFVGRNTDSMLDELEAETGRSLRDVYPRMELRARVLEQFSTNLKPIPYVAEALDALQPIPLCIASGSGIERNTLALNVTGLLSYFEGRIYSSLQVPHGKPAPDVFLFAAAQMGVAPEKCLVIEDSVPGIEAAKAAKMAVFAYAGGSHVTPDWRARLSAANPDALFDDMRDLPGIMANIAQR